MDMNINMAERAAPEPILDKDIMKIMGSRRATLFLLDAMIKRVRPANKDCVPLGVELNISLVEVPMNCSQ